MVSVHFTFRYMLIRTMSYCVDSMSPGGTSSKCQSRHSIPSTAPPGNGSPENPKYEKRGSGETRHPQQRFEARDMLTFISYVTYFPLYLCGPLMTFNDFKRQKSCCPSSIRSLSSHLPALLPIATWILVVEISLRTFYYPSFVVNTQILTSMTTLESWIFTHALICMLFLESYLPWALSRACAGIDGTQPPDDAPEFVYQCTTSFRHFMRRFHVSWHLWLKQYVYCPLGGGPASVFATIAVSLALHGLQR